jgi:hypothetical protein
MTGQTASLYIVHGLITIEVGQTANSFNDRKFDLNVVVTSLMV